MKKTISIIIAAVMGMTLVTSAFAQGAGPAGGQKQGGPGGRQGGPQGGPQGGRMRMNPMQMDEPILAKLNLSGDQKKQVKNLKEQTGKKMKELMEKGQKGGDRTKMREEFRSMMKGYNDGLEKILTAPQQAQYKKEMEAARKKMREQWGNRQGGPGAGGPGAGGPGKGGAGKGKPGKGGKNGG